VTKEETIREREKEISAGKKLSKEEKERGDSSEIPRREGQSGQRRSRTKGSGYYTHIDATLVTSWLKNDQPKKKIVARQAQRPRGGKRRLFLGKKKDGAAFSEKSNTSSQKRGKAGIHPEGRPEKPK